MTTSNQLGTGAKLALIGYAVLACAACAAFALLMTGLMQREMLAGRVGELRAITDSAKGIAAALQEQVDNGELSRDEALRAFRRRVQAITYDNGQGYVFAYRMDGIAVATPYAAQIGTDQLDVQVNGRPVIREIRDAVRDGGGTAVIRYDYRRPGDAAPVPKMSYAAAFPAWDMFIGTGAYVDDIEARFRPLALQLGGGAAALALLLGGLAWITVRFAAARPAAAPRGVLARYG